MDFGAIARIQGGGKAKLAGAEDASRLTGCAMGAVPPFSFHPGLSLLVDARLVAEPEIVFNAGRLDRSVVLRSDHYRDLAKPRIAEIAA